MTDIKKIHERYIYTEQFTDETVEGLTSAYKNLGKSLDILVKNLSQQADTLAQTAVTSQETSKQLAQI